jgi:hypothetical protein
MNYIIKTQCKEATSQSGKVMTQEGKLVWVIEEPEGWVPATSSSVEFNNGCIPKDVLTFDTYKAAELFISQWKGHPWYVVPNGVYEIIEVVPRMKTIQDGWDINELHSMHTARV